MVMGVGGAMYTGAQSMTFFTTEVVSPEQDPYSWRTKSYVNLLDSTLRNYKPESRILQLTDTEPEGRKSVVSKAGPLDGDTTKGWPCVPRKKPVVGQPDIIFDLPGYQANMHNDILGWGKRDLLIAALGKQIFMWHSPSNNVVTLHSFEEDTILVAKWDPSGVLIAVGTLFGRLYIYDSVAEKMVPISSDCYRAKEDVISSITAVAWNSQGYCQLACCTSTGSIGICDSRSKGAYALKRGAHSSDILHVSFSPDGCFLVTSGMDCMVRLWCLPDIVPYFEIMYSNPARALTWHPWRGCQLAVGGGLGAGHGLGDGSLSIWDVSRQTNLCHRLPSTSCAIDAMAWSSHTGELAVSYWIDDINLGNESDTIGQSRLLILASPTKVSDELCAPPSRTRALLFNPDGTKIASASAEENLFIWNFLGKPGPLLNMYRRKIKRKKLYHKMLEINEFNNFGVVIR